MGKVAAKPAASLSKILPQEFVKTTKEILKEIPKATKGGAIVAGLTFVSFVAGSIKHMIDMRKVQTEINKKYEQKAQELTN